MSPQMSHPYVGGSNILRLNVDGT